MHRYSHEPKGHHIGRTVHAGEGRSAKEIAVAIIELKAQRIGHGTTLLEEEAVTDLVIKNNVCIEACVTSNLHTGVIKHFEEHPIAHWIDRGIAVSICTDNTLLSHVNSPQEYARVRQIPGMSDSHMEFIHNQTPKHTFF